MSVVWNTGFFSDETFWFEVAVCADEMSGGREDDALVVSASGEELLDALGVEELGGDDIADLVLGHGEDETVFCGHHVGELEDDLRMGLSGDGEELCGADPGEGHFVDLGAGGGFDRDDAFGVGLEDFW